MRSIIWSSFGIFILGCLLGCGGSETPVQTLDDADKAFRVDKDYTKAMALYRNVLEWKGEGQPTSEQRFEASLYLNRCKISSKDFDGAVAGITEMWKIYSDTMTLKNFNTFIGDLVSHNAISQAIDILTLAGEAFPDQKEMLKAKAELIINMGATDEDLARLKTLGYL